MYADCKIYQQEEFFSDNIYWLYERSFLTAGMLMEELSFTSQSRATPKTFCGIKNWKNFSKFLYTRWQVERGFKIIPVHD